MSLSKESVTLNDFYKSVYKAATNDSFGKRFKELSQIGSRQGMVEAVMEFPCVSATKVVQSYFGKDDELAMRFYRKSFEMIEKKSYEGDEETRACEILTQALFAASAHSQPFIDALIERAKRWYSLSAYAKCLKDCEYMLALPSRLYEKTDSAKHFLEYKEQCLHLKEECCRKLKSSAVYKMKKQGKKMTTRDRNRNDMPVERSTITIPSVDRKRHSNLESCSDAVTLQYDDKRGRHLVATRDIETGSVLIVDRPFTFSTNGDALERNCLHCHVSLRSADSVRIPCHNCRTVSFCSENCRKEAWEKYHRYECVVFNFFFESGNDQQHRKTSYLLLAYRTTVTAALDFVEREDGKIDISVNADVFEDDKDTDRDNKSNLEKKSKCKLNYPKDKYKPDDYKTVLQLETHCKDAEFNINLNRTIEAIFLTKCLMFSLNISGENLSLFVSLAVAMLRHLQAITCNAYEIIENVYDESTHVWEPRNVGGAIYPTVSLVNHSCYPNIVRHSYPRGTVVVRAIRFIPKDTEILDCYGPHFLSEEKLTRREYLWRKYRFLCTCIACTKDWRSPITDAIYYKCTSCTKPTCSLTSTDNGKQRYDIDRCYQCREELNGKRIEKELQKSIKKRLSAISKMFQGKYEEALPLLLDHARFIEKFLVAPNNEAIKTQQCIVQCYNSLGCTAL